MSLGDISSLIRIHTRDVMMKADSSSQDTRAFILFQQVQSMWLVLVSAL